jgi:hypothetical protein
MIGKIDDFPVNGYPRREFFATVCRISNEKAGGGLFPSAAPFADGLQLHPQPLLDRIEHGAMNGLRVG